MTQNEFLNWFNLYSTKENFIACKVNTTGEQFLNSRIVHLQARSNKPGILLYKTAFDQEFKEINFKRNKRQNITFSDESLKPLRTVFYKKNKNMTIFYGSFAMGG